MPFFCNIIILILNQILYAMEVKSFLIEEHESTIFEPTEIERWQEIVSVLGLEKQKNLMKDGKSMMPFPAMTEAEREIYRQVLDYQENYVEFDNEAIPLKILGLIALCEKEKYFDGIEIWYSKQFSDPLAVGYLYDSEASRIAKRSWSRDFYLIGAWGAKIKHAADLLDLWHNKVINDIKSTFDWNTNEQLKKYEKFKFQLSSLAPSKKQK